MGYTRYLNATCVSEEMLGFAYIDTTTFNASTCAISAPSFDVEKYWTPRRILSIIGIFLSLIGLMWVVYLYAWHSAIQRLRMVPTASTHQTIESWTEKSLSGHARRKFEKFERGRFQSVTEVVDQGAQIRTVVIVENLSKKPLSSSERKKMPKVPKGWQEQVAVPGALAADIPLERVGSSAELAVMDQAHVSENGAGTPEIDIGSGPPAYKHFV